MVATPCLFQYYRVYRVQGQYRVIHTRLMSLSEKGLQSRLLGLINAV